MRLLVAIALPLIAITGCGSCGSNTPAPDSSGHDVSSGASRHEPEIMLPPEAPDASAGDSGTATPPATTPKHRAAGETPAVPRAKIGDLSIGVDDDVVFRTGKGTWVARAFVIVENMSDHPVNASANFFRVGKDGPSGMGSPLYRTLKTDVLAPHQLAMGIVAWEYAAETPMPTSLDVSYAADSKAAAAPVGHINLVQTPAPVEAGWLPSKGTDTLPVTVTGGGTTFTDRGTIIVRVPIHVTNPTDARLVLDRSMFVVSSKNVAGNDNQAQTHPMAYSQPLDPGASADYELAWGWSPTHGAITAVDVSYGGKGHLVTVKAGVDVKAGAAK